MTDQLVKDNERVDDLQNGYYVIQDPDKFCFGMDAVLLSGFAKVKKGEIALDMGTGTGIIPILLKAKTSGKHFACPAGLVLQEPPQPALPGGPHPLPCVAQRGDAAADPGVGGAAVLLPLSGSAAGYPRACRLRGGKAA